MAPGGQVLKPCDGHFKDPSAHAIHMDDGPTIAPSTIVVEVARRSLPMDVPDADSKLPARRWRKRIAGYHELGSRGYGWDGMGLICFHGSDRVRGSMFRSMLD